MVYLAPTFLLAALATSLAANAETYASKEWAWSTETGRDGYYYAATLNKAGHLLGQYCYFETENCMYLVALGTTCDEGQEYPALVNSDSGAVHVKLVCAHKYEGQNVLAIDAFEEIDRVVRNATKLGIVLPLQNDEFKVSRFGLAGSTYAIDLMRAAAERRLKVKPLNADRPDEERI
jgi:hypothetical protein